MSLPTGAEYQDAIQTPRLCFEEPELRAGWPEVDAHGLPLVASGNFASVYKIVVGSKPWAVKCFTRYTRGLENRYTAISQHLKATNPRFHVPFEYLAHGIRVENQWYSIVKMQWVDGLSLNDYVSQALRRGDAWILRPLAQRWRQLASALRGAGVAHCDLHHGNVIIEKNRVKLVDYDGMFVPDLQGQPSNETGHPSYQHPGRRDNPHFDETLDRFSLLVVYVALRALIVEPGLWGRFDNGDNMLFTGSDFLAPADSELFFELTGVSDKGVRDLAFFLQESCAKPLAAVPEIESIVKGDLKAPDVWVRYRRRGRQGKPTMYVNRSLTRDRVCFAFWAAAFSCFLTWWVGTLLGAGLIGVVLMVGVGVLLSSVALHPRYTSLVHTARNRQKSVLREMQRDIQNNFRSVTDLRRDADALEARIGQMVQEREALQARETQVLAAALKAFQGRFREGKLSQRHLQTARIPGIGAGIKAHLDGAGVVTAADVNHTRVMSVDGIGESRAAALLSWRESVEGEIERMLPDRLPPAQKGEVVARYQDQLSAMVRTEEETRSRLEELCRSRDREEATLTEKQAATSACRAELEAYSFDEYLKCVLYL